MQYTFSKQFFVGRKIKMECLDCYSPTVRIKSKSCQDLENYRSCIIFTKCENCGRVDDFFINKDYYGYIDAQAEPLRGEWKL